jgi:hypothetical protein
MKKTAVTLLLLTSIGSGYAAHSVISTVTSHEPSPLSIAVNGQIGTTFRLVDAANNGWGFADRSGPKLPSANPQQEVAGAIQATATLATHPAVAASKPKRAPIATTAKLMPSTPHQ